MNTLKHMFAALSAAVLAFCAAAAPAYAAATPAALSPAPDEIREYLHSAPVYALGSDLSLYLPGDADLDGKVDGFDATLILMPYVVCFTCGWELLTPDQIELANVDGRTSTIEFPVEGGGKASAELKADAYDSSMVLRYFVCRNAGIDCTMEQIVNFEVEPPEK